MTQNLVIATRSGTVTGPDGRMFAIVRGRTVADARHPAVTTDERNWMPFEVELKVEDGAASEPAGDEALTALRVERDEFAEALNRIAEALRVAGHVVPETPMTADQLAEIVVAGIEAAADVPEPVAPPAPPRKRAAPKA